MPTDADADMGNAMTAQESDEASSEYIPQDVVEARFNPQISPNDDAWLRTHKMFTELLKTSKKTIDRILKENFSRHDAIMFSPSGSPDIAKLQDLRTRRYQALVQSQFKGVDDSLASKLTMMYFGKPVPPISSTLDELALVWDSRAPVGPLYEVEPPLHFLTAHQHRNWGKDELRQKEAPILPIPLDMDGGATTHLSLRGGAAPQDEELSTIPDHFAEGDRRLTPKDDWVYLYGFRGCVPFVTTSFSSYRSAVEKLLSLPPDKSDQVSNFSLFLLHTEEANGDTVTEDFAEFSSISASAQYLQSYFSETPDHQDRGDFFIKLEGEPNPACREPSSKQLQTDVAKIGYSVFDTFEDPEQTIVRYAYLPFPKVKGSAAFNVQEFAANQCIPHLQNAIDVLIGKSKERFHNAVLSLYDNNDPNGRFGLNVAAGSLGGSGTHTDVWNQLHPLNNPNARWMLKISHVADDEIAIAINNYYRARLPTFTLADGGNVPAAVRRLIKQVWTPSAIEKMKTIKLHAGTTSLETFSHHAEVLKIELDQTHGEEKLKELDDGLNRLISVRPKHWLMVSTVWKEGESRIFLSWVGSDAKSVELPGLGSKLAAFKAAVASLCEQNTGQPYNPDEDAIFVRSISDHCSDTSPVLDTPSFLIDSTTNEQDWFRIRSYITSCSVQVTVMPNKLKPDWDSSIPKSMVWGIRADIKPPSERELEAGELLKGLYDSDNQSSGPQRMSNPSSSQNRGSIRIWEDNSEENDRRERVTAAPEKSASDHPNRPPVTENDRARSWHHQPSIFDQPEPRIPINAPPSEHIIRTTSHVPMVSQAMFTPTEHVRTESAVWNLRNLITTRSWKCAHIDCQFSCHLSDVKTIQEHLEQQHGPPSKCMWCNTLLYEHWSEEQRVGHLRREHMDKLIEAVGRDEIHIREAVDPLPQSQTKPGRSDQNLDRQTGQGLAPLARHRPPRTIEYPLSNWYDFPGPQPSDDPCQACPLSDCLDRDVSHLDSRQIYEHFQAHDPDSELMMCPFCDLELFTWVSRGGEEEKEQRPEYEIIKHIDCHVYCLWEPLEPEEKTGNLGTRAIISPKAPVTTEEGKRCPLFANCGAIVQHMTDEQLVQHLRDSHKQELGVSPSARAEGSQGQKKAQVSESRPRVPLTQLPAMPSIEVDPPRTGAGVSGVISRYDDWLSNNSSDMSPSIRLSSRLKTRKRNVAEIPRSEQPNNQASVSRTANATSEAARNKTTRHSSAKRRKLTPKEPEHDSPSRGRSSARSRDNGEASRQRSPSPDWNDILGPEDPYFVPSEDMYCSRCLRKAPKLHDQSPGRSLMGRDSEMKLHTAPDRCCKIRNGVGMARDLPNRSGWIYAKTLRQQRLGSIKEKFLKKYPRYAQTLYPTKPTDHNTSLWRSDPNNEDNKAWWDIPWPPFEGDQPFPGSWEYPGDPEFDYGKRKREPKPTRGPQDSLYRYMSDNDSDDALEPDVDDTQQFIEKTGNETLTVGKAKAPGKKRKAVSDAPEDAGAEDAQPKARPSKKLKATKGAAQKKETKKPQKEPTRPTRATTKIKTAAETDVLKEKEEENIPEPDQTKAPAKPKPKTTKPSRKPRAATSAPPTRASSRSAVVKQRAAREGKEASALRK